MATKKLINPSADASCGCEVPIAGRKAVSVDPELKGSNLRRLSRSEGQVHGIRRMVEEGRYCADILTQVSSRLFAQLLVR